MKITLSERMRDSIREAQQRAKRSSLVLDVYKTAKEVQNALPGENVALEDIVTALLSDQMNEFGAFELHRRNEVIEITMGSPLKEDRLVSEAA